MHLRAHASIFHLQKTSERVIGTPVPKSWTVLSLIEWGAAYLAERGFDESRLHVELLLAHVLQLPRMSLYLQFDRPLVAAELAGFKPLFERRLKHEPLQYILGETDFMGLPIFVDRHVLIPRPETENLVEKAVACMKEKPDGAAILDIGTGSGNIPAALARFIPTASVVSVDVSTEALAVARKNIERHGFTNVRLVHADLFADPFLPGETFDLVISNPPYIPVLEYAALEPEVRDFEPRIAATDGGDGLKFVRRIAALATRLLRPGGAVMVEIGFGEGDAALQIFNQAGLANVGVDKDFAGIPRIVHGIRMGASS